MLNLPVNTVLGNIKLLEVLEFYDFPRLFTCTSSTGRYFIALSIADEPGRYEWLYLPISSSRINAILTGGISLYLAFKEPEDGYLLHVVVDESGTGTAVYQLPESIEDESLPLPNYRIRENSEYDYGLGIVDAHSAATASRRETINYRIFPNEKKYEISSRKLGNILVTTQELIDALGQAAEGVPTIKGAISASITSETKLSATRFFHGSFGVQLQSEKFSDLLGDSMLARALNELGGLLSAMDSEDLLSNKLHALKGRVASKYRKLLRELTQLDSGLVVEWGSVRPNAGGNYSLSEKEVKNAYSIVDRIDFAMSGEISIYALLIGFNARTRRFEIFSAEEDETYTGKVSEDAVLVESPAIGEMYTAKLKKMVETQPSSGDEIVRWVLVELRK